MATIDTGERSSIASPESTNGFKRSGHFIRPEWDGIFEKVSLLLYNGITGRLFYRISYISTIFAFHSKSAHIVAAPVQLNQYVKSIRCRFMAAA